MPTFDVASTSPTRTVADVLVLPIFQGPEPGPGVAEVGEALGADLISVLKDHRVTGKLGETFAVPSLGRVKATSVVLVGLGPKDEAGAEAVRKASLKAARAASKFRTLASTLPQVGDPAESGAAFAEGITIGGYRFDRYKVKSTENGSKGTGLKKAVALAGSATAARTLKDALRRGRIYGEASNWARDLVNTPAKDATPSYLAAEARRMAGKYGLKCRIWTKPELEKGGFGGILGVGAGSANDPRLIELQYQGAGDDQPIGLTGKGVTFDSGGLSLKDAAAMEWMKADMGGAAAALATMRAVAQLGTKVNVIAAIPSSENLPGGSAIRPGDVLIHRSGKTSEVLNTDAEGRLILADALAYLAEKKPRVIIESATLTGAAMVALGTDIWAVMGNDQGLIDELLDAGRRSGEPGWQLPLWADYKRNIESTVADVKNTGPRYGGAINAGLFLKEFVGDVPWAHLDVAGTAFAETANEWWPKGATGSPARTFIRYIESQAKARVPAKATGSRRRVSSQTGVASPGQPVRSKRATRASGRGRASRPSA
jgi:leucyl aminopeptidase